MNLDIYLILFRFYCSRESMSQGVTKSFQNFEDNRDDPRSSRAKKQCRWRFMKSFSKNIMGQWKKRYREIKEREREREKVER